MTLFDFSPLHDWAPLANHLWQSTVCVGIAWLLALALRKNRAAVRYWIWFAASVKFLIPLSPFVALGGLFAWRFAPAAVQPQWTFAADNVVQPFAAPQFAQAAAAHAPHAALSVGAILLGLWLCGVAVGVIFWLRCWRAMRVARRAATRLDFALSIPVTSTPSQIEPGVFGIFRPVLLLPSGIESRLTLEQLNAVLAHEMAHVRRRDNLTAAIHMLIETIFWFFPLVWWLRARLIEEREQACDEAVLRMGSEAESYAEGIIEVCKSYAESPAACISRISGSDLKKRVIRIVNRHVGENLTRQRKIILACAGIASLIFPILAGVTGISSLHAQSATGPVPKWEVISIKPCDLASNGTPGMRGGGGGNQIPPATFSPNRMMLHCQTTISYIRDAYLLFPNAQAPEHRILGMRAPVEGTPDWVSTERYTIEATSEGTATPEMMEGPMLQVLLEDRFKLKLHHETREVPVYDLVVAKGGPKLTPFDPASCTPYPAMPDIITGPPPQPPELPAGQKYCSHGGGLMGPTAVNVAIMDEGDTIDSFCKDFLNSVGDDGRRVIDKTGITGKYTIHLEYAPDDEIRNRRAETGNPLGDPTAPEIFTAIQEQLGLKLVPDKGPGDFLVIDHIEQPSPN